MYYNYTDFLLNKVSFIRHITSIIVQKNNNKLHSPLLFSDKEFFIKYTLTQTFLPKFKILIKITLYRIL